MDDAADAYMLDCLLADSQALADLLQKDSIPSSPASQSSRETRAGTPVDYKALQAWLPPIPYFERQRLSSEVLQELRYACAVILKETTPADADLDQTDPLEVYKDSLARAATVEKAAEPKIEQRAHTIPRKDSPRTTGFRQPSTRQNQHISSIALQTSGKDASLSERIRNLDVVPSFPQPPKRDAYESTSSAGQDFYKPQPHMAASSDYIVHESSRTSITHPGSAATHSARDTAITSFTHSPRETLRDSSNQQNIAHIPTQPLRSPGNVHPGSAQAKVTSWATGGRSRREHEGTEGQVVPKLRKSTSKSSFRSQTSLRSRAESIRENFLDYVRPASRSSSRPGTSSADKQLDNGRPQSRSSMTSAGGDKMRSWWRGSGLRRRGSISSGRQSIDGAVPSTTNDNGPNLDKSLPPMPSLDSYMEPHEPKLHISQLMVPIVPAAPQDSMTSPNHQTPGVRSPGSFQTAQGVHSLNPTTDQRHPSHSHPTRSATSTALKPGNEQTRSHKTRSQSRKEVPDRHTSRTFYSPAHKSATADLTQFSDDWREGNIQKEAERRLKRERERQLAKEQKKHQVEAKEREQRAKETREKERDGSTKLKNRLSRMFGHSSKASTRPQTAPSSALAEVPEALPEAGRAVAAN